jgi:hypothetical protein
VGGAECALHEALSTGPAAIDACAAVATITVSAALRRNDRSRRCTVECCLSLNVVGAALSTDFALPGHPPQQFVGGGSRGKLGRELDRPDGHAARRSTQESQLSRAMENCPLGATRNCPLLG